MKNTIQKSALSTNLIAFVFVLCGAQLHAQDAALINVTTLDQLNAIRYDVEGDGIIVFTAEDPLAASAGNVDALAELSRYASQFTGGTYHIRAGDNSETPIANASAEAVVASTTYVYKLSVTYEGYELMNNLDFARSRWADGASGGDAVDGGWEPIGDNSTFSNDSRFTAIFEGNGHTISNLFIDRSSDYVGLFGFVSESTAALRNIGLLEVKVRGNSSVGGLVGDTREGTVSNSYATGSVTGTGDNVGGLVGNNEGDISVSYATGAVTSIGNRVGGLVGASRGTVSHSYATGAVTGDDSVGGLVGINSPSTVSNSYATGAVTGSSDVGGLVGRNNGTITASYYNSHTTGQSDTGKGESKITAELQTPTGYAGIYATWTDGTTDYWDFGTNGQYPVLKLDVDGNGTAGEVADLRAQRSLRFRQTSYAFTILNTASINDVVGIVRAVPEDANNGLTYSMGASTEFSISSEAETNNLSKVGQISVKGVLSPNIYTLNVEVTEAGGGTATVEVRIKVGSLLDADTNGLIEVSTLEQLNAIRYDVDGDGTPTTAGNTEYTTAFGTGICTEDCTGYELMNNLDFARSRWADGASGGDAVLAGWEPIGDNSTFSNDSRFTAIFEGNGHTISNLFIDRSSTSYVGLFGYISRSSAALRNIGLLEVKVTGSSDVGGLVGFNQDGTISNSYATGSVTGLVRVGGLVGESGGTVSNSYATGSVTGTGTGEDVGGLVGSSQEGTLSNSYATGSVTGTRRVGGLVGYNQESTISGSYATGSVTGTGTGDNVGGLVGRNEEGTVSNSYATGAVTGDDSVGGLVGNNTSRSTVSNNYATGLVMGTGDNVGGLVGNNEDTITASYYNRETTGQIDTGKGEGKTTAALLTPTGYMGIYDSWDDDSTDDWDFGTNEQYPVLKIDVNGNGTAGDDADLALQRPPRLSVNLTNLDFMAGGEGKDFIITSNADWTAEVSDGNSWLTLDMTSGTNNATVKATAVQNVAVSPRMATITLTAGTLVWIINVTQMGTMTVPVAPTSLTATAMSDMQIDLSWEVLSDGGSTITDYVLEYSADGNTSWTVLTTSGTMTTFSDNTGLTAGTTRYYRVAAINRVGTGAYSEKTSATTHDVPVAPTSLTATAMSATQIDLTWGAPSDGGSPITDYVLEYSADGNTSWTVLTTSGTMTTFSNNTGLIRGTTRHYRVAAINSVGTGAYSEKTSATTHDVPDAPKNLTATPGEKQVTLSWEVPANGGDDITHYAIKIAGTSDALETFSAVQVAVAEVTDGTIAGTNVNYVVTMTGVDSGTPLVNNTEYFFQVAAVNSVDTGEYSASDSATPGTSASPAVPASLTVTPGDAKMTLSWEVPANGGEAITHYAIKIADTREALGSFVGVQVAVGDLTGDVTSVGANVSYIVTVTGVNSGPALVNGTTYFFQIAAVNSIGTGNYTNTIDATTTVPDAPTNLTATAVSATEINLSWDAPSENGGSAITGYDLEFSENGSAPWMDLTTSSTMITFSDNTGLTAGSTRHYRVAAINNVGTGAYSDEASATTHDVPDAPMNLTAAVVSETQIDLSWDAPSEDGGSTITGYDLEYSVDGSIPWMDLTTSATTIAFSDNTGLTAGTTRHYRVAAINDVGTGEYTTTNATTTAATTTVPGAPTNLTATAVSDTQIDLSWDAPSEDGGEAVTGYDLEYSEDGNEPWTDLTTSVTTTSFDDTGLTAGSTRHYRVAAINAVGTGAYSEEVSATASSPVLLSVPLEVEDSPGVYPNPGSDKVYVNLPNGNGAYVVRLHTLTGKVVLQKQLQGGGTRTLSLSKLQDGLYILNVQKDGQNSSYRLIKATH